MAGGAKLDGGTEEVGRDGGVRDVVDAKGDTMATACRRNQVIANQVVIIGDSWAVTPTETNNLGTHLRDLARAAGAIGRTESYRNFAVGGVKLAGGRNAVPTQYANAQREAPIKVLIMDGGGNDLKQSGCNLKPTDSCEGISAAVSAAKTLFNRVAADGTVQHIVFFFYPDLDTVGVPGEDFLRPRLQSVCQASTVPCYFLDLRQVFAGHPEFIGPDHDHPSAVGVEAFAKAVWAIMQKNCVAQ